MAAMDSQMQDELVPSARVYVRDTRPSHLSDLDAETDVDAFSSVRRKRGR